jgi:hypothetical protein
VRRLLSIILAALVSISANFAWAEPVHSLPLAQLPSSASAAGTEPEKPKEVDGPKWTDVLGAWGTVIATFLAALSALYSWLTAKQAEKTAKALRLSELWGDIASLQYLSEVEATQLEDKGIAETVRKNVNTMSKIGLWWTCNLIDRKIAAEEMADSYVILYDQIKTLGNFPSLRRNGMELLKENPHAIELYEALKAYVKPEGGRKAKK